MMIAGFPSGRGLKAERGRKGEEESDLGSCILLPPSCSGGYILLPPSCSGGCILLPPSCSGGCILLPPSCSSGCILPTSPSPLQSKTVPDCHNLYRSSFTYHCLRNGTLDFADAIQFLEKCEREKSRVLVHCMSGKNRSAAVVTAFLMKSRGWRLAQCFQWVKDRRPQVLLTDASQRQLVEYEQKLFGPSTLAQTTALTDSFPSLGFGLPTPSTVLQVPAFCQAPAPSIFERVGPDNAPSNFTFGAEGTTAVIPPTNTNGAVTPTSSYSQMDSS